jgi:CRISPR-associated protein Cas6
MGLRDAGLGAHAASARDDAGIAVKLPEIVDVVLDIAASASLPPGFEWALYRGVLGLAPWLANSPHAGILPLRGAGLADGGLLLARRAKLVVRMPRDRVCAASNLESRTLDVGGVRISLGHGTFRKLRAASTLYSPRVALDEADEVAFGRRVTTELRGLAIDRPFICGRRVDVAFGEAQHPAYGVAVHGLQEEESLRLQAAGLGQGRVVGCGLFVPHKSIGAIGAQA